MWDKNCVRYKILNARGILIKLTKNNFKLIGVSSSSLAQTVIRSSASGCNVVDPLTLFSESSRFLSSSIAALEIGLNISSLSINGSGISRKLLNVVINPISTISTTDANTVASFDPKKIPMFVRDQSIEPSMYPANPPKPPIITAIVRTFG